MSSLKRETSGPVLFHRLSRDELTLDATLLKEHGRTARTLVKELGLSSAHVLFPDEHEATIWSDAGGFMVRHGVQYHWHNKPDAPFTDYEDFLKTLPQKKRTQIRRERKQPAMDGLTIETLGPNDLTPEISETKTASHRKSPKSPQTSPGVPDSTAASTS
jgi:hypothetical protein